MWQTINQHLPRPLRETLLYSRGVFINRALDIFSRIYRLLFWLPYNDISNFLQYIHCIGFPPSAIPVRVMVVTVLALKWTFGRKHNYAKIHDFTMWRCWTRKTPHGISCHTPQSYPAPSRNRIYRQSTVSDRSMFQDTFPLRASTLLVHQA